MRTPYLRALAEIIVNYQSVLPMATWAGDHYFVVSNGPAASERRHCYLLANPLNNTAYVKFWPFFGRSALSWINVMLRRDRIHLHRQCFGEPTFRAATKAEPSGHQAGSWSASGPFEGGGMALSPSRRLAN
jgi:hypothetical protein